MSRTEKEKAVEEAKANLIDQAKRLVQIFDEDGLTPTGRVIRNHHNLHVAVIKLRGAERGAGLR